MDANEYHMTSHWRVLGTPEEVYAIITKAEDLPRWWPAAFTESLVVTPGEAGSLDRVVRLESRGFLPYRLRWHVAATETDPPRRLVNRVWGDFNGVGVWTLTANGDYTTIDYDWRISVNMPLVKLLSPLLKPLFVLNHRWAMAKGQESLEIELRRRHAVSEAIRNQIPVPPGGIDRSLWALAASAFVALMLLAKRRGHH